MSGIQQPVSKPEPGMLYATRVLIHHVGKQPDPERAAEKTSQDIEQRVQFFRRRAKVESPEQVAQWMHGRVDKAMRELDERTPEGAKLVRCTRGCTACCYQQVVMSEPEARLAVAAARAAGHAIDMDRARTQAAGGIDPDAHQRLSHADRRCVMLKDDGDCAIYEHRPTACRSYRVISDPADCDTERNVKGGVTAYFTPMAEVLVSAAMRADRYGSLGSFLIELDLIERP